VQIPNIGPRGRRQRLTLGVVSLGVAVLLGTVLLAFGAAPGWRFALFVPLWIGALGIFQALDKT
jgi:hypothetical protein